MTGVIVLKEDAYNYMKIHMLDRAYESAESVNELIKQLEIGREERVKYYLTRAAEFEEKASHARILRVCLTGKP